MAHNSDAPVSDRAGIAMRTAAALTALKPCILCQEESDVVGVYAPDDRPAKLILYPVCVDCLEQDNAIARIEEVLASSPLLMLKP